MLANLGAHGGEWYAGCGRYWHSDTKDVKAYRALVARGFVEEREIILHGCPKPIFLLTQAGREWYFRRTGKLVQRHPFAKITDLHEEGEFPESGDASLDAQETDAETEFDEYLVRDDGIQGWTVSVQLDNKDRRIIGERKVWWVSQWGFDEAKRLAEQHADWLNDDGPPSKTNTGPAIAVPIMIAPFQ